MLPVQITFQDMPNSPAVENHIRNKVMKLNHFYDRINSCRIVIHIPQKHKQKGKLFSVHIDLTVPGKELVVNRKLDEDMYVAIRDAFKALQRQLEDYACKQRGEVKTHEMPLRGAIKRILKSDGYGFIQGYDGHEYYFSMTNVSNTDFSQLSSGDIVEFISIPASEGMQAQHVTVVKNNHVMTK